jgi:hypothetical protein
MAQTSPDPTHLRPRGPDWQNMGIAAGVRYLRNHVDPKDPPVTPEEMREMLARSEARPRPDDLPSNFQWDILTAQIVARSWLDDPSSVSAEQTAGAYRITVVQGEWRAAEYGHDRRSESRREWLHLWARLTAQLPARFDDLETERLEQAYISFQRELTARVFAGLKGKEKKALRRRYDLWTFALFATAGYPSPASPAGPSPLRSGKSARARNATGH